MKDTLWVVNPLKEHILISAPRYADAIIKAEENYKVKVESVQDHHDWWFRTSMANFLNMMAQEINPGFKSKIQWEIHILDKNTNIETIWGSAYVSVESAILEGLAYVIGECQENYSKLFTPDTLLVTSVSKLDNTNKHTYDSADLITSIASFMRMYDGLEETYKSFNFKETELSATGLD